MILAQHPKKDIFGDTFSVSFSSIISDHFLQILIILLKLANQRVMEEFGNRIEQNW